MSKFTNHETSTSIANFITLFSDNINSIRTLLLKTKQKQYDSQDIFVEISTKLKDSIKLLSESSLFLPTYDIQQSQKTLDSIQKEFSVLKPQSSSKFSFRHRKQKETPYIPPAQTPSSQPNELKTKPNIEDLLSKHNILHLDGLNGEKKVFKDGEITNQDISLNNLSECSFIVNDVVGAVFMKNLNDCSIYISASSASIILWNCQNCLFFLASHQIRIHQTYSCDFYLYITNKPIIEDCNELNFAPFSFPSSSLYFQHYNNCISKANLSSNNNIWYEVEDFKWHKQIHSPHWNIIETEKQKNIDDFLKLYV